jgi:hypothetical protein
MDYSLPGGCLESEECFRALVIFEGAGLVCAISLREA